MPHLISTNDHREFADVISPLDSPTGYHLRAPDCKSPQRKRPSNVIEDMGRVHQQRRRGFQRHYKREKSPFLQLMRDLSCKLFILQAGNLQFVCEPMR
jgi:hypothetical protein